MTHPRSIYKSDFGPHSWFENNFSSDVVEEFCSPDNIDDCLKYISQEFSALGYPSIYTVHSSSLVNCDSVKLVNVIFEIVKDLKEHAENKEELESRNQRLTSDYNVLNKKHIQLKELQDRTERKLNISIEKERQLKEKNDQLQSLLKAEKDEAKKLSAQIQQQKVAYQREIRKNESNLTQMKNKLNQVLMDKNPDKRIANISTSHLLQRSSNQRAKWKTESLAKSSTDEMYNSVISNYENRCQMAFKEIEEYRHSFQFVEQQLEVVLSFLGEDSCQKDLPSLSAILNGSNIQKELLQKLGIMFSQVQHLITDKVNVLKSEILNLKSIENSTNIPQQKNSNMEFGNHSPEEFMPPTCGKVSKGEKDKTISEQKEDLSLTLAQIKEEKSKLEAQKLIMIKSVIKQQSSNSPQCSKSVPSFCVLTTKNGITTVPDSLQLKQCLSYPDYLAKSLSPLWKADLSASTQSSPSSSISVFGDSFSSPIPGFSSPQMTLNDDLPKWARAASNISISEENPVNLDVSIADGDVIKSGSMSSENSEVHHSEEDNLEKLKAFAEDIENRRIQFLSKGK